MAEFIFGREEEQESIRQRLSKSRPFLLYGPVQVGKTLLLRSVLKEFTSVLYCENSATAHSLFRTLATHLFRAGSPRLHKVLRNEKAIASQSAVSLKGIVMDALKERKYAIVLDHVECPSHAFAAVVREIEWTSTPVSAVARSAHMEDVGFLWPLYSDRSARYEIRNFEKSVAEQFARGLIRRTGLAAANLDDFLDKALEFSSGNPGAIKSLVEMAKLPKYRSDENIKITPLYIDFRLNWDAPR